VRGSDLDRAIQGIDLAHAAGHGRRGSCVAQVRAKKAGQGDTATPFYQKGTVRIQYKEAALGQINANGCRLPAAYGVIVNGSDYLEKQGPHLCNLRRNSNREVPKTVSTIHYWQESTMT